MNSVQENWEQAVKPAQERNAPQEEIDQMKCVFYTASLYAVTDCMLLLSRVSKKEISMKAALMTMRGMQLEVFDFDESLRSHRSLNK